MFVRIFALCCPLLFFGLFVVGREQIHSFTMDSDRIDSLLGANDPAFLAQRSLASSDLEFYRRVSLDLCGTIPTVDEAWTFEMNSDPDKRRKMIDHLLGSQAHVFHMAEVLDVWWMERSRSGVASRLISSFATSFNQTVRKKRPARLRDFSSTEISNPT